MKFVKTQFKIWKKSIQNMIKLILKTQFSEIFVVQQIPKTERKDLESSMANPRNSIEIWKKSSPNMKKLAKKRDFRIMTNSKNCT